MNERPLPSPSDAMLVRVPFVFGTRLMVHRGRKERSKLYRAVASLQIERTASAEVAYTIELGPNECVRVLLHRGRLIWPMKYTTPFRRAIFDDALRDLRDGTLDLFSNGKLRTTQLSLDADLSWKKIVWNGEDDALQALWRRSQELVIVDNELYALGGVPILVTKTPELNRGVFVASSGADRHGDLGKGLFVKPGGFHQTTLQKAIARGRFRIPAAEDGGRARTRYPRIVTHHEVLLDALDLRIDAIFREYWRVLNVPRDFKCEETDWIRTKFEAALDGNLPALTAARCEAFHAMLACDPGSARYLWGLWMTEVLEPAAAAGRTMTHAAYLKHAWELEDASIAALADHAGLAAIETARDGAV